MSDRTVRSHSKVHLPFRKVAVLGAGTMGAQIAAHLANAGQQVLLLDLRSDGADASAPARRGLERIKKLKPDPFFLPAYASRVRVGNFDDDLSQLGDAEWVIEAIVERADAKRELFGRVAQHLSDDAILSTNTSGIPIAELADGLPSEVSTRFLGTHFFNPPRYLKLLEVIPHQHTASSVAERIENFGRLYLGKSVIVAKDTPYFIANRIGVYAMATAIRAFVEGAYSFEEIEAVTGPLTGRPKSATFRTADVVGLDVLLDVLKGLHAKLTEDESRAIFETPSILDNLVASGRTGAKSNAGFYRKTDRALERIEADGDSYGELGGAPVEVRTFSGDLPSRLRELYEADSRLGDLFRRLSHDLFAYSARRVPEISASPADVDRAMRWGFGWEMGPFEMWDAIGFERVRANLSQSGIDLPAWVAELESNETGFYHHRGDTQAVLIPTTGEYRDLERPRRTLWLPAIRSDARLVVWESEDAVLLDIGDCVALLEFRSKANSLTPALMKGLLEVLDLVENVADIRGLVIGNEGKNFSVGANLAVIGEAAREGEYDSVGSYLRAFQTAIQRVRYCRKPVVVAVHQRVLGGACELLMASPEAVASAESYVGLVEVGVGLIPAGTGLMHLARLASERAPTEHPSHILPMLQRYFEQVVRADVSRSADEAKDFGYLAPSSVVVMNDETRLYAAREQVIRLSRASQRSFAPSSPIVVLGRPARAAFEVAVDQYRQGGYMSDYDSHISSAVARVMTGGDIDGPATVSEEYLLDLEREVFLQLLGEERTRSRIDHMLKHKKPLRN